MALPPWLDALKPAVSIVERITSWLHPYLSPKQRTIRKIHALEGKINALKRKTWDTRESHLYARYTTDLIRLRRELESVSG